MEQKIRILQVSRPAAGGMRNHLRGLIEGLSDEFDLSLAAPGELPAEVGVRGYQLDIPDRLTPFRLPWLVLQLVQIIHKEKPAIIHAHGYVAGTVAALAGPVSGAKITICTLHNLFPPGANSVAKKALQVCGRSCKKLIAITNAVKESAARAGVNPDKFVIIPNGIDPAPYQQSYNRDEIRSSLKINSNAPLILTATRLIPAKGIEVLLGAVANLKEKIPQLRTVIAGDGPHRSQLEQLCEKMELTGFIQFLGERKDIPHLLAASDLVVVPSLAEGQSLIVLEGMASHLPVIASDVGGMREMIQDGKTGLLVPPANPTALAQAIGLVLADKNLAKRLGDDGAHFVESEMTLETMISRTRALYHEMLK